MINVPLSINENKNGKKKSYQAEDVDRKSGSQSKCV